MKKMIIICIVLFLGVSSINAQFFNKKDVEIYENDVAEQARDLVKDHLDLTEEQDSIFWPLYDEFNTESQAILDAELDVLEEYLMYYYILKDKKATELMRKSNELKRNRLDLQEEYFEKMSKVLPPKLVGKFFQIDYRINLMINHQRTDRIPLVRDQDKH
ncbi:MAG: hypothetical protein ABFS12_04235 [Bacteroidota bacterium]